MKRSARIITVLALLCLFQGCYDRFIADPVDPRLPAYTESGYGIGGAFFNDDIWINADLPGSSFKSPSRPGMRWHFSVEEIDSKPRTRISFVNGFSQGQRVSIVFYLHDIAVSSRHRLATLAERRIDLNNDPDYAELLLFQNDTIVDTLKSTQGAIYFRHVKYIENAQHTIVSGTFGFEASNDSLSISVKSGRYDFEADDYDFFGF